MQRVASLCFLVCLIATHQFRLSRVAHLSLKTTSGTHRQLSANVQPLESLNVHKGVNFRLVLAQVVLLIQQMHLQHKMPLKMFIDGEFQFEGHQIPHVQATSASAENLEDDALANSEWFLRRGVFRAPESYSVIPKDFKAVTTAAKPRTNQADWWPVGLWAVALHDPNAIQTVFLKLWDELTQANKDVREQAIIADELYLEDLMLKCDASLYSVVEQAIEKTLGHLQELKKPGQAGAAAEDVFRSAKAELSNTYTTVVTSSLSAKLEGRHDVILLGDTAECWRRLDEHFTQSHAECITLLDSVASAAAMGETRDCDCSHGVQVEGSTAARRNRYLCCSNNTRQKTKSELRRAVGHVQEVSHTLDRRIGKLQQESDNLLDRARRSGETYRNLQEKVSHSWTQIWNTIKDVRQFLDSCGIPHPPEDVLTSSSSSVGSKSHQQIHLLHDLLSKFLLVLDPSKRLDMANRQQHATFLAHPFWHGLDWKQLEEAMEA